MAEDFLHKPLGQSAHSDGHKRRRTGLYGLLAGAIAIVVLGGLAWRAVHPGAENPGGVVAKIEPAKPAPAPPPPPAAEAVRQQTVTSAEGIESASGVNVIRPDGALPTSAQILQVPQDISVSLQPAPDPRLVEPSRYGPLPRRGPDGARPADVYARPLVVDSNLPPNAPRVALLVGGMGLNAALTTTAVHELAPAVTFGFAPYGDNLPAQVQAAREAGHESILQIPMEGFGDPASAAMSHLLTTGLDGKELLDRLHWFMGRFPGYAGVGNFLGSKFSSDATAFTPVLRDIADRGLYYVDDGSSARSLAPDLSSSLGLRMIKADASLDSAKDSASFDGALDRLLDRARARGCAVGVASGLPATVTRLATFAKSLDKRGFALVPVSACVTVQTGGDVVARP